MTDTIVAVATARGRGAIGILRLSGPQAADIAAKIGGELPPPRQAGLRALRDAGGNLLDRGLVLQFRAPNSYTGEDLVELQAHGGAVLLDLLLRTALAHGARLARPGEFSERAFVSGRLDLAQAEAVADLIDAASVQAVTAASRSLEGEFSAQVHALAAGLMQLRVWVEGALDFGDEDVDWLADAQLHARLHAWREALSALQARVHRGRRLRDGLVLAIAGRPNVGKSSLLNRLAGAEVAIVSDLAGTTRDALREHLVIDGLPVTIVDTAGLRETDDRIEQEGIRRTWAAVGRAEALIFVVDDRDALNADDRELLARMPPALPRLIVRNKLDLNRGHAAGAAAAGPDSGSAPTLRLSASTGEGCDALVTWIRDTAGFGEIAGEGETTFTARTRHVEALEATAQHVARAAENLAARQSADLVAEELRLAQSRLGAITGEVGSEDLLGAIFGSFCIGK